MKGIVITSTIVKEYLHDYIDKQPGRSAWSNGVRAYAHELADNLAERASDEKRMPGNVTEVKAWLLDGARDWAEYSYGGCSLIYDDDIVERLCTPGERRRYEAGKLQNVNWLDVQARALYQAARIVTDAVNECCAEAAASAEYIKASGEARKHA